MVSSGPDPITTKLTHGLLQVKIVTRSTHLLKKTDKVQTGSTKFFPWFGQARVPQSNLHALNKT